jgi:GAF domain-containing protein
MIGYSTPNSTKIQTLTTQEAQQILAMLNATPQALARLDEAVMSDVDECMQPQLDEYGIIRFRTMAQGVADLAVRVMRGERAAVYMRTPGRIPRPKLLAESVAHQSTRDSMDKGVEDLVVRVLETHRAKQVDNQASTYLATPIPGGFASPQTSAIGVLWVCREGRNSFSAYDLALARNMCLRLAVLNTTAIAGRIAQGITELRGTPMAEVAAQMPQRPEGESELPPDVELAIRRVPSALKTIARDTNSHSVTIRVALPDSDGDSPQALALRRVAAYPHDRLDDLYKVLRYRDGGINWQVVLTDRVVYVPDTENSQPAESYLPARKDTKSELALPIRSDGRLVGTLNLESSSPANYGPLIPQAIAFAGAMGRAFADAQAYYTQPVLERAAEVLDHGHDYESHLLSLRRSPILAGLSEHDQAVIQQDIEEGLRLITDITRGDSQREVAEERATLWDTLREAYEDTNPLLLERPNWDNRPRWDRRLRADEQRLIFSALRNVLLNIKRYSGISPVDTEYISPHLSDTTCIWAGREYVALTIRNSSSKFIANSVASRAYRVPFPGIDGKLRLGAYLAALRLRQINGLVSFSAADAGWSCRTTLLIPRYVEEIR